MNQSNRDAVVDFLRAEGYNGPTSFDMDTLRAVASVMQTMRDLPRGVRVGVAAAALNG